VENKAYLSYISQFADQDEVIAHCCLHKDHADNISKVLHCIGFAVLWNANHKKSKGLHMTSIGTVSCACHELFWLNGMGEVQKGEQYVIFPHDILLLMTHCRYANINYLFFSSIVGTWLLLLIISYDIACQWGTYVLDQMNFNLPEFLCLASFTILWLFVSKFHLLDHKTKCYNPYSFNFAPGVGHTNGEGVEQNWSVLNGVAHSILMMGLGGWWNTLDDFCNYLNWRKMVTLHKWIFLKCKTSICFPPKNDLCDTSSHHSSLSSLSIHREPLC
jgi:hypothetical protein